MELTAAPSVRDTATASHIKYEPFTKLRTYRVEELHASYPDCFQPDFPIVNLKFQDPFKKKTIYGPDSNIFEYTSVVTGKKTTVNVPNTRGFSYRNAFENPEYVHHDERCSVYFKFTRDLLIHNKIGSLQLHLDGLVSGRCCHPLFTYEQLMLIGEGIKASSVLEHISWIRCEVGEENANYFKEAGSNTCSYCGATCISDIHLTPIKLLAEYLEGNRSVTSVDDYVLSYPIRFVRLEIYEDKDRIFGEESAVVRIREILQRNLELQCMNSMGAQDKSDGLEFDPCACPFALAQAVVRDKLKVHASFFDAGGDRCFCAKCHVERGDKDVYIRGKPGRPYILPVGWCRFGLSVNKGVLATVDPFANFHNSYHGTDINGMGAIFKSGLRLLHAGEIAAGGLALGIKEGHIPKPFTRFNRHLQQNELFDPCCIFTSPSIKYSSHPAYAPPHVVDHPTLKGKRVCIKVAFQLRQRPDSYIIGQETVAAKTQLDPHISNDELEYYTREGVSILTHGLLVHV